jgi:hydroxymethylbilane synthase
VQANQFPTLRIGTRGSPLALAQARLVARLLREAHDGLPEPEIVVIKTTGDRVLDRALSEVGGKGLFTKEIEEALLDARIDLAVHSMKDMPTVLPEGLEIVALLEREDPRDAFLSPVAGSIAELPAGALVGSASLRRQAQILNARPDLRVETLRGNVNTRLDKLARGEVQATLLALAGLRRLGLAHHATTILSVEEMLPAVAQGAIGIETRGDDDVTRPLVEALDHGPTTLAVDAERALLAALDGSCRTPIAALATLDGAGGLSLEARIFSHDGRRVLATNRSGPAADGVAMGADAGAELLSRAGPGFFAS